MNSLLSKLMRALLAPAMPFYAFDPKDPADAAILEDAIEKALAPVKAKNAELLGELRTAKRGKGGENDAEVERLETELAAVQGTLADANKALKAAAKAAEDTGKALAAEQAYTSGLLVDNGIMAALTEAGVSNPVQAKAAAALIKSSVKIEVKADGTTRAALVDGKPLSEHVKGWAGGDEGKHFVAAPANGGGNAPGSQGGAAAPNPWMKETFNLTQQGKILTENPTQAAAFRAAAGVPTTP